MSTIFKSNESTITFSDNGDSVRVIVQYEDEDKDTAFADFDYAEGNEMLAMLRGDDYTGAFAEVIETVAA